MSNQNVPALRLKGFSGEWSQSVLGSFARKVNEKNVDLSVAETFTNSAEKGVISQTEYFKHQVSNDMNLGGYYVVQPNDFIYNPRISTGAPVGPINRNKLERVGVVSPLYTVFRLSLIDHSFLDWFFKSPYWHGFMRENGDSGARGDRLSIGQDLFFQMPVATPPTLEEQQAIGAIFTNLDAAINQHTLKHKSLQQAKTALMQRMFPQDGQTVPELRLEGFSGEWSEAALGDFGYAAMDKRVFKHQTSPTGDVPFYKIGTFGKSPDSYISWDLYREYTAKYVHPSPGTVLISASGSIGRTVVYDGSPAYFQDSNIIWLEHGEDISDTYLKHFYTVTDWGGIEGTTIKRLYNEQFLKTKIVIPPTLEEQQAIGAVFTQLDTLIATEAQYIASLKQAKTALLQRMFI